MFKRIFYEEVAGSGLEANDLLVDAAAAALIMRPRQFGCLVTLNLTATSFRTRRRPSWAAWDSPLP